ncbi:hypothetical protein IWQ62_004173 [Dispira parvispora]|uniref:MAGE domain-containing protein n=1 Tax=Dispira parvispora TaxID=1520584 RepID=A0A9W8AQC4_9FUNG|nr:hypothetical protein IWQ62_004173 [Dispira parvispora]
MDLDSRVETASQSTTSGESLLNEHQESKVNSIVRYALFCEHRKQPIKREDINRKTAQSRLRDVFGMEMVELPAREMVTSHNPTARRAAAAQKERTTSKAKWILCNALDLPTTPDAEPFIDWDCQAGLMGITGAILSLIFLNNMALPADRLEYYLQKLDPHPLVWGVSDDRDRTSSIQQLLANLVRMNYLDRLPLGSAQPPNSGVSSQAAAGQDTTTSYEYRWGPRAKVEFPLMHMARLIANVSGEPVTPALLRKLEHVCGQPLSEPPS